MEYDRTQRQGTHFDVMHTILLQDVLKLGLRTLLPCVCQNLFHQIRRALVEVVPADVMQFIVRDKALRTGELSTGGARTGTLCGLLRIEILKKGTRMTNSGDTVTAFDSLPLTRTLSKPLENSA